jgi:beta-galactosidase
MKKNLFCFATAILFFFGCDAQRNTIHSKKISENFVRERININAHWRFMRYADNEKPDTLFYDVRPDIKNHNDNIVADTKASLTAQSSEERGLKNMILPTANFFIKNPEEKFKLPKENPKNNFPFLQENFNDESWEQINLPHDWAIGENFYKGANAVVGGGMGRLPTQGVAWYRKKINISETDKNKSIYLDIDGAMSYAMVWCNGYLAGGWAYGYNSFQMELTPYLKFGAENIIAIRVDNPNYSSRWYTGGGIYRNVWLTKVNPIHVAHWGTFIRTKNISPKSATAALSVQIENATINKKTIKILTDVYDDSGKKITSFPTKNIAVNAGEITTSDVEVNIGNPQLWQPIPEPKQHLYIAVTSLYDNGKKLDEYVTKFGIRDVKFDPNKGLFVNGKNIRLQGVNQHSDLGALGMAFNKRAAERQLEILKEMGCNAIRLSHNPPAPELLELTDSMGFMVIDEIFDCWEKGKNPLDFHLIFNDWYEADLRSFIRRDRNHPSVIEWSFGNEVGEQYTGEEGAALAKKLYDIVKEEDSTRPATASMNYAKPDMPFPKIFDVLSLNYQGEGIRDAPAYAMLKGIRTAPLYDEFKKYFPDKMIQSSETSTALSTRGTYTFPVAPDSGEPVSDSTGGNSVDMFVSDYGLYTAPFGASPDKVFAAQDKHPFVAGEFVWSGFDYLGEPTPYYDARSSYSGVIDLAGFKKDRYFLYQSRWRPDFPMAHILPHWTWHGREGKTTPVHIFTSGDEAELFLNNKSLGRKRKNKYQYRLRWDSVVYEPGVLKVVAYKNGKLWATDSVQTAGTPAKLELTADRKTIKADGNDLLFITVKIVDKNGVPVPDASNKISFTINGPGEIVATDNGDPANLESFASKERKAFSGLVLAIVKSQKNKSGKIIIRAFSEGLKGGRVEVRSF